MKRVPFDKAIRAATTHQEDFVLPYVRDLRNVVDMDAIRGAGLKLGVDPLGGAARPYWEPINAIYGLDVAVVNPVIDPTFSFMTVDHDGKIRMDCSSPYAMARLVGLKDQYQVAFANDPDSDRHGIVTPVGRVDEPEPLPCGRDPLSAHAPAAVAARCRGRQDAGQQQHDRPRRTEARPRAVRGAGRLQMVRRRASSTARAASAAKRAPERASCASTAPCGRPTKTDRSWTCSPPRSPRAPARIPGEHYRELTAEFGTPYYTRIDAPATPEQKAKLQKLSPDAVKESDLAGEPITAKLTRAPGNNAPIGGLKVVAASGWFAARPSGTENIYKIYAESFKSEAHLNAIVSEAQEIVNNALRSGAPSAMSANGEARKRSAVSAGLPRFRHAAACHVSAIAVWHRRSGTAAFAWVDRLQDAGQGWWQALPLGPTGYGNSPVSAVVFFCRATAC